MNGSNKTYRAEEDESLVQSSRRWDLTLRFFPLFSVGGILLLLSSTVYPSLKNLSVIPGVCWKFHWVFIFYFSDLAQLHFLPVWCCWKFVVHHSPSCFMVSVAETLSSTWSVENKFNIKVFIGGSHIPVSWFLRVPFASQQRPLLASYIFHLEKATFCIMEY
jgi:hypothetical protein